LSSTAACAPKAGHFSLSAFTLEKSIMAAPFTWQSAPPEEHNLVAGKLATMWDDLAQRGTAALLIARSDRIVYERYADDWHGDKRHYTASLAKAVVGGLALALAMDDGLIAPDDPAHHYIPQWRDDPLKAKITIRHLATHTSGLEDAELSDRDRRDASGKNLNTHHMELPGWKGAFWRQEPDPFILARDEAPVIFKPGSAYAYSNTGIAMLSYAVTAALRNAPCRDIRQLLHQRLLRPMGIPDDQWSIGYGKIFEVDGLPLVAAWGGGSLSTRATAGIARLLLANGAWEGVQLLSPVILRQVLSYAGMPAPDRGDGQPWPAAGLGFWTNADGVWPLLPPDTWVGAGAGDQTLLVIPSLDLIAVRYGAALDPNKSFGWKARVEYLFNPLVQSLLYRPPYPPSPTIRRLDWAPVPQIARQAMGGKTRDGSDNWPMAWADDGHLYTAYGDGYGFEPGTATKLGMGLAVITGGPDDFAGYNIRSDAENSGYGAKGAKSSGLLSLAGTLYMWVRNADGDGRHSRLGWSTDHGKSWNWNEWEFELLGHPAFVNFGRDYQGARDNYVYMVSHDDASAYTNADHFVLMRVPQEMLRQREKYQFLQHLGPGGTPVWSDDIAQRGPVFTHPGQCRRSSISYNATLDRYFWWQQMTVDTSSTDTRFKGGFGVYDAPEPWGPWTTVFFTEQWDVGPGDLGCFPAKWMSADGKTMHLVFAGSDHFAVRRVTLTV
jgi:CubicO group peptidase (beta-lactamase class C family)